MKQLLSAEQIKGWQAYSEIERWWPADREVLHGIQCEQIVNTSLAAPTPPAEARDFMPSFEGYDLMSTEEISANAREWSIIGGTRLKA